MHQLDLAREPDQTRYGAPKTSLSRGWIAFAAASGAVSVIVGAFAAHGLSPDTESREIGWLHTGAQYQSLHALAMLAVVVLAHTGQIRSRFAAASQWLFLTGNILFPAALYGLAFHLPRWLGAIAPLGGAAFILGWISLAVAAFAPNRKE